MPKSEEKTSKDSGCEVNSTNTDKPKLKPCCACPETRRVRDDCILERGESECQKFIDAHKECLKQLGFQV